MQTGKVSIQPTFRQVDHLIYQFACLGRISSSTGILTCCPSPTPCGLGLGPTNPGTKTVAQETSDKSASRFFTLISLLVPTFSLLRAPPNLTVKLHCCAERSPTTPMQSIGNNKFQITNIKWKVDKSVPTIFYLLIFLFDIPSAVHWHPHLRYLA